MATRDRRCDEYECDDDDDDDERGALDVRDVGAVRRRSKAPSDAGTSRRQKEEEDASTLGVWSSEFRRLQRGHRTVGSGTGGETVESERSRSRRETKCGSLE